MIIQAVKPGVARRLAPAVRDPQCKLVVDAALAPALGLTPAPAPADPTHDAFLKAARGYAMARLGVPSPLTLKLAPGLAAAVLPPGTDDMTLRFALGRMEEALKEELGPGMFSGLSFVLAARENVPKLLDPSKRLVDRGLAGAKVVNGAARALEQVWPQIRPWREVLGVALTVAEGGRVAYLGYQAYATPTPAG
jgi:hypothetical protein